VERTFKRIDPGAARKLLSRPDVVILDVRDAASFHHSHIPAAVNVHQDNVFPVLQATPKEQPVLIYCYHGHASQTYAQLFADFGFHEVYSLDGGYTQWDAEQGTAAAS
jgi:thiosulfate/3-mercaptopyruvate sulfurtransferase